MNIQSLFLQDSKGDVVKLVCHDEWSEGEHITVGTAWEVYFAKVLPGKGDRSAEMTNWVYNDAYIRVVGQNRTVVSERKEVTVGAV